MGRFPAGAESMKMRKKSIDSMAMEFYDVTSIVRKKEQTYPPLSVYAGAIMQRRQGITYPYFAVYVVAQVAMTRCRRW